MNQSRSGDTIVAESFLEVRAKLLEIAATFDRIERASAGAELSESAAMQHDRLVEATKILLTDGSDRAERLQQLFSREYQVDWRQAFGLVVEQT